MTERADPRWPSLPLAEWQPTRDTLQLWSQIVGKIRMENAPLVNHWWNTTLYVTDRGLCTSLVPYRDGRGFSIEFDFLGHQLHISVSDGAERSIALEPKTTSTFYAEVMHALDDLGLTTRIWTTPVEIPGETVPFDEDEVHATYEPEHAQRFWAMLVQLDRVLQVFRSRFIGKVSPVHFFWGGFDLAVTRFSGRTAPRYPRGAPNCGPHVMEEAYSHEVSSAGYWPGAGDEGVVYSYAYPELEGFRDHPMPDGAHYDEGLGEFVLPYATLRQAPDPDALLLDFLQAAYEAAAESAAWDRAALER